jgi:hypothetical protein
MGGVYGVLEGESLDLEALQVEEGRVVVGVVVEVEHLVHEEEALVHRARPRVPGHEQTARHPHHAPPPPPPPRAPPAVFGRSALALALALAIIIIIIVVVVRALRLQPPAQRPRHPLVQLVELGLGVGQPHLNGIEVKKKRRR